ncbi:unnamed protein product [Arctogadus glacialis]
MPRSGQGQDSCSLMELSGFYRCINYYSGRTTPQGRVSSAPPASVTRNSVPILVLVLVISTNQNEEATQKEQFLRVSRPHVSLAESGGGVAEDSEIPSTVSSAVIHPGALPVPVRVPLLASEHLNAARGDATDAHAIPQETNSHAQIWA